MHLLKKYLVALVLLLVSYSTFASLTNPELDKDYKVLSPAQSTDSPGKIEVTEFFFYTCPHCNALDPYLTEWVKKQGNAISFKRVHVDFGQQQALARMFYTLEAMGKLDELHSKIFKTIHVDRVFLRTDQDMVAFVTKNGVDPVKYQEVSKSFSVESKLRRGMALQEVYKIDSVPNIFVDGRFNTSPGLLTTTYPGMTEAEAVKNVLTVLDGLVLKAQKEHAAKK